MMDSAVDENAIGCVEFCEGICRARGSSHWRYAWYGMWSRAEYAKLAGGGGVVGLLLVDLALEFCEFGEFEDGVEESGGELILLPFEYGGFIQI